MKNSTVLTTSRTAMTIKRSHLSICLLLALLSAGCATTLPPEPPLCVPLRPVLQDISVEDQLAIRRIDPDLLSRVATNDTTLKSHIVVLERVIYAHDEPLGSCD